MSSGPRVLVVDNYDSFVYNLVQYLGELGAEPLVHRADQFTLADVEAMDPDAILISPGPGRPEDAGLSNDLIRTYGGRVVRAPQVMHGKTSLVRHDDTGVLAGLPSPFEATRYHSLIVERETLPDELEVTATTADGVIMGLRHRELPIEGVQFHPESILTSVGKDLLTNFLGAVRV